MARISGTASANSASAKVKKIKVEDYRSFKEYVANEDAAVKTKPLTTDDGPVLEKMRAMGIEFVPGTDFGKSRDNRKIAHVSPDKKGILLFDSNTQHVSIFNPQGKIVQESPAKGLWRGRFGFSNTRLFHFGEAGVDRVDYGFGIYSFTGQLVKKIDDIGVVEAFMVSNDQKRLAVVAGVPEEGDVVVLYDMEGLELWRQKTVLSGNPRIIFSRDDKFMLVKMPVYWISEKSFVKKFYVFDVKSGKQVSQGTYED